MAEKRKNTGFLLAVLVSVAIVAAALIVWHLLKAEVVATQTIPETVTQPQRQIERPSVSDPNHVHRVSEPTAETAEDTSKPKMSLSDIVNSARYWGPSHQSWFGKSAPDFDLVDITGKRHKLSDYRGKNVMIIFWATWCGPCKIEVPHLIALRNIYPEDKLAILAISYKSSQPRQRQNAEMVKAFAKQNRINYSVFSVDPRDLSAPFNRITSLPSSFFIDPEGKIKLATMGLLTLPAMKGIIEAE